MELISDRMFPQSWELLFGLDLKPKNHWWIRYDSGTVRLTGDYYIHPQYNGVAKCRL